MLYDFSKILWAVIQLGNLLVLVLVVSVAALLMGCRRARIYVAAVTVAFVAITVLPLGHWAIRPLETRFPQPVPPAHVDGIVLLGGAIRLDVTRTTGQVALNRFAERITSTVALARRYPNAKVVVAGGDPAIYPHGLPEAEAMRRILVADGVEDQRILLDTRSRNTFENAIYAMAVARPAPNQVWLLVTSAFHMPRAVGCFRHVGWTIVPYPVDYQTPASVPLLEWDFLDDAAVLDLAWHEWLGLVAYRLLGRIDTVFPGPAAAPASPSRAS